MLTFYPKDTSFVQSLIINNEIISVFWHGWWGLGNFIMTFNYFNFSNDFFFFFLFYLLRRRNNKTRIIIFLKHFNLSQNKLINHFLPQSYSNMFQRRNVVFFKMAVTKNIFKKSDKSREMFCVWFLFCYRKKIMYLFMLHWLWKMKSCMCNRQLQFPNN